MWQKKLLQQKISDKVFQNDYKSKGLFKKGLNKNYNFNFFLGLSLAQFFNRSTSLKSWHSDHRWFEIYLTKFLGEQSGSTGQFLDAYSVNYHPPTFGAR